MEKNWSVLQNIGTPIKFCVNFISRALFLFDLDPLTRKKHNEPDPQRFVWHGGWSGSTAFVPFGDSYLGILHRRSVTSPGTYAHIFALCDSNFNIKKTSEPFNFEGAAIEFCCGITQSSNGQSLIISYSTWDKNAKLIEISHEAVNHFLIKDNLSNCGLADIGFDEIDTYLKSFGRILECINARDKIIARLRDVSTPT